MALVPSDKNPFIFLLWSERLLMDRSNKSSFGLFKARFGYLITTYFSKWFGKYAWNFRYVINTTVLHLGRYCCSSRYTTYLPTYLKSSLAIFDIDLELPFDKKERERKVTFWRLHLIRNRTDDFNEQILNFELMEDIGKLVTVWPDLAKFPHFNKFLKLNLIFGHNLKPSLANFVCHWATLYWCKSPKIKE